MANRRQIKKTIKSSTNQIIEDGFMELINSDKKEKDSLDKVIDEVVDYRLDLLKRVNSYPKHEKRGAKKKYFKKIKEELNKSNKEYDKKIGHVS